MNFYRIYGLNVNANFDSCISSLNEEIDVCIKRGEIDFSSSYEVFNDEEVKIYRRDFSNDVLIKWKSLGHFLIHNGQEIIVQPEKEEFYFICPVLFGPIFAILLHQRGYLVLHASAVVLNNRATAFMGHSGYGKSTIAATMNKQGYPFLTDDILAVKFDKNSNPIVYPSLPLIKLSPEFFTIEDDDSSFMEIFPGADDKISFIPHLFSQEPLKIDKIYFLKEGSNVEKRRLKIQDALMNLIENSYCNILFNEEEKILNLLLCSNLLKRVNTGTLFLDYSINNINQIPSIIDGQEYDE